MLINFHIKFSSEVRFIDSPLGRRERNRINTSELKLLRTIVKLSLAPMVDSAEVFPCYHSQKQLGLCICYETQLTELWIEFFHVTYPNIKLIFRDFSECLDHLSDQDTWINRGAELSTDVNLVVSWIHWQRGNKERLNRPKRIVMVCWEHLLFMQLLIAVVLSFLVPVTEATPKLSCGCRQAEEGVPLSLVGSWNP